MATPSAWALSPRRSLMDPVNKEEKLPSTHNPNEVTFQPALPSDPLRAKVPSSSYGKVIPPKKDPPPEPQLDPEVTFKPILPEDPTRAKVSSTGYGKAVINKPPPPEAPSPSFKPELSTHQEAVQLREKASSSGYGKAVVNKKPPPEPEKFDFRPNLATSPHAAELRNKVPPGHFMLPVARPQSAPAQTQRGGVLIGQPMLRHTLYLEKKTKEEARPPSPEFTLDGVAVANTNAERHRLGMPQPSMQYQKIERSDSAKAISSKVKSHGYGTGEWTPPVKKAEVQKTPEPRLTFSREKSAYVEGPLPKHEREEDAVKEKVSSSGYGPEFKPESKPREQKPAEPVWRPSSAKAKTIKEIHEMPAAPKPAVNEKVQSTGYMSSYVPPSGEKKALTSEPKWNVIGKQTTLKQVHELERVTAKRLSLSGNRASPASASTRNGTHTAQKENISNGNAEDVEQDATSAPAAEESTIYDDEGETF